MNFENIPEELKTYPQWVVWKAVEVEGRMTKRPYNALTGTLASPTNPATWCSYEDAIRILEGTGYYNGIGFVLSESDPYAFIDLDDPYKLEDGKPKFQNPEEHLTFQRQIFEAFPSYSEISPSGKGLHIICKGKLPHGKRKGSVELYTQERYMTMTGNAYRNVPIVDCQETLSSLFEHLGGIEAPEQIIADSYAQTAEDAEIIKRAASATNSAKFIDLLNGNWQGMYQSQSEADFAFIDIIAFYTDNKEQVKRIFNGSKLGERGKKTSTKGVPYVDYMVNRSFDKKLPPVDHSALTAQIEAAIETAKRGKGRPRKQTVPESPYSVPPGLVGKIANYIYQSAPRPVAEVALAGAIGLVAGMAGRAFNISGTGLNQYILLLAKTGIGKEAISSGVSSLVSEIRRVVPTVNEFLGPTVIASPQALIKKLAKNPSFVSIIGEFGLKLQQMTQRGATAADRGVMTAMLDLFNKSGKGAMFGAMAYSDSDKNIDSIEAPALSILGESTPKSFYAAIDESTVESGLVPRFTVIEYKGDRPDLAENRISVTDCPQLVDDVAKFAAQCAMLNHQNQVTLVEMDKEAARIFREYNIEVDSHIRGSDDISREVWNRAHIKALKLAALIAVGVNWLYPCVTADMANWAIRIENLNVGRLLQQFAEGNVGQHVELSESYQLREVRRVVKEWLTKDWEELGKYDAGTFEMFNAKVLPAKYVSKRLANTAGFRNDKRGATVALQRTLNTMCEHGDLQATKNKELYKSNALCYVVTNVTEFLPAQNYTIT